MEQTEIRATAAYYTLGCKLNFAETSTIGKMLRLRGIGTVQEGVTPDLCIVNTCSVTDTADKKARSLIRRLARQYPDAAIVVTGCYAQLKPEEIASLPGVVLVLGSDEKLRIAQYLDAWMMSGGKTVEVTPEREIHDFMPSCERGDRTRYFLKVQDGCDYFCTYCTIPYARGRSRSGTVAQMVEEARKVAAEGGREIVITGVNTGDFGKGRDEDFFDLIRALDEVEGISRYRISSIEPNLLRPEIIEWVARSRAFMPHFHIPLQSGSDKVLRMMNRRYDTTLFAERIAMVRECIPDAFVGVDVIAGARGETSEEWDKSYRFIESLPVTRLHVFPYSERPDTAALLLSDSVANEERHRRVAELMSLSDAKMRKFTRRMNGSVRPVLWESLHHHGKMHGLTDNYLRVEAEADKSLINNISEVRLGDTLPDNNEIIIGQKI